MKVNQPIKTNNIDVSISHRPSDAFVVTPKQISLTNADDTKVGFIENINLSTAPLGISPYIRDLQRHREMKTTLKKTNIDYENQNINNNIRTIKRRNQLNKTRERSIKVRPIWV